MYTAEWGFTGWMDAKAGENSSARIERSWLFNNIGGLDFVDC